MKATIEIPDDLYAQVKAKAALQRMTVKEVAVTLFQGWTEGKTSLRGSGDGKSALEQEQHLAEAEAWMKGWVELGRKMDAESIDPRSASEILKADRR